MSDESDSVNAELSPLLARVNLAALRRNLRALRARLPREAAFSALVKSDGYGHGMADVARVAVAEGCQFLAVATVDEVLDLRAAGFAHDALVLGPVFGHEIADAVRPNVAVCVGNLDTARALSAAARERKTRARVHLKIDTGMGRFGFLDAPASLGAALDEILALPGLEIEGALTHFSEADAPGSDFTDLQMERFRRALDRLRECGLSPRWVHAANSGGALHFPDTALSMTRLGLAIYGAYPGPPPEGLALEPAMTLTCRVADLRDVPAGTPVSYQRKFVTARPSRLAVLPFGYGNGYPRAASNRAEAVVGGRRAPLVGAITMNLTVADVTDLEGVAVGDPVLLFGRQGDWELRVEELARAADMIPYEILCNVGRCAPRIAVEDRT